MQQAHAESSGSNYHTNTPRALSKGQERKAVEFLEYSFQDIENSFKKRCAISGMLLVVVSYYTHVTQLRAIPQQTTNIVSLPRGHAAPLGVRLADTTHRPLYIVTNRILTPSYQ